MTTERKGLIALAVLALAALASWGAREHTWSKRVETLTAQYKTVDAQSEAYRAQSEALQKESDTAEDVVPVQLPNGTVAYATHRTSRTVETALRQASETIASLTKQVEELKTHTVVKEVETVRSAPRWNAVVGWEPLQATYYAGAGVNFGPLSLDVDNPVSLNLRPRLTGMIRF